MIFFSIFLLVLNFDLIGQTKMFIPDDSIFYKKLNYLAPLNYSTLFQRRSGEGSIKKEINFSFLRDYEIKTYDLSKYYIFHDKDWIPYQITNYNPSEYYHLKNELIIIKRKE